VTTAEDLRDEGIATSQAATPEGQKLTFDTIIQLYADSGEPFTSDSLRADWDAAHVAESARGGLSRGAATRGVIVPTGAYVQSTHPKTHAHPVRQWIGAQWHREDVAS